MLVKMIPTVALLTLVFVYRCSAEELPFSFYIMPTGKLDLQVDIALLMQHEEFGYHMREFVQLLRYLEVAEDKVHIGAWYFSDLENKTIVDLTSNASHFQQALKEFKLGPDTKTYYNWGAAFSQMVDVFKATGRPGIPKLMYATYIDGIAKPTTNYSIEAEKAGLQLLARFCFYYGGYPAQYYVQLTQLFPSSQQHKRYVLDDLSHLLCEQKNKTCTFNTSGACITYGGSLIPVDPLECRKFPNLTMKSSDKAKCEKFCNDHVLQWPNKTEACAGKCGKTTIQRNRTSSNLPQWKLKMLSRCPTVPVEEKEVECDCTTTTTTSSTPKKLSTASPLLTISAQRPTAESSKPFPWWATLLIVAAVAIGLLIIILAVVIRRRRRMQKKPAPASEKTSVRVTSPKGKAAVEGGTGVSAAVGGEKGAVKGEENIGVSLKEDVTVKSVKAKGSSNKTSIKESSIKGSPIKTSIKGEAEVSEKDSKTSSRAMSKVVKGSKIAARPKKA